MSDELEEATRIIEELVGLESFRVTEIPSKDPRARLYMARALVPVTIGIPPIVIADGNGVRLLDRKKMAAAFEYAGEHGLEPLCRNQP